MSFSYEIVIQFWDSPAVVTEARNAREAYRAFRRGMKHPGMFSVTLVTWDNQLHEMVSTTRHVPHKRQEKTRD